MAQMQLLPNNLADGDEVYTPDFAAKDMVEFFQPFGKMLEPCSGDGAILKYLSNADWCEIQKGKDFFQYTSKVDWIITNPPYSQFWKFLEHSMSLADNIVFLIPCYKVFNSVKTLKAIFKWGGIPHMRIMGTGNSLGFPYGYSIGAFYFKKGYSSSISYSFLGAHLTPLAPDSLKAGVLSLPESVKVENALPAVSG